MPENTVNFFNKDDGCTYCWDIKKKTWWKICPVDKLPYNIKKQALEEKIYAEQVLDVEVW